MTGQDLRRARHTKGLSIEKLAHLIGVHRCTVSNWERGAFKISRENREKLESVLGKNATTTDIAGLMERIKKCNHSRSHEERMDLLRKANILDENGYYDEKFFSKETVDKSKEGKTMTGADLRRERKLAGITQWELGNLIGVSQTTIGKLERGDINIQPYIEDLKTALREAVTVPNEEVDIIEGLEEIEGFEEVKKAKTHYLYLISDKNKVIRIKLTPEQSEKIKGDGLRVLSIQEE